MNENIKVLRSIISSESILTQVILDYDFATNSTCKLIKTGGSNDIYIITSNKKKYILKLYSKRSCWEYKHEHYLFELELQKFLCTNNILVPNPIENKHKSLISYIDTPEYKKYYAIYTYVNGIKTSYTNKCEKRLILFGQSLAKMHNTSKKFKESTNYKRTLDLDFLIIESRKRICKFIDMKSLKLVKQFNSVADIIEKKTKLMTLKDLEIGIVHGDMHSGNHFYSKKTGNISFFDFELCGYGYYIYDLATFKWSLLHNYQESMANKILRYVINGYSSINNSLESSLKYIDLFIAIRTFFMMGARFYPEMLHYNNEFMTSQYLRKLNNYLTNHNFVI